MNCIFAATAALRLQCLLNLGAPMEALEHALSVIVPGTPQAPSVNGTEYFNLVCSAKCCVSDGYDCAYGYICAVL